MYPPAVASCHTATRTITDSVPSAMERRLTLLRRHQVSPQPLPRVRLGLDVLGVVRPADHHLDVPEQLVDVLPLLSRIEVRELPDARLHPVHAPLEPLVGRDRRLP